MTIDQRIEALTQKLTEAGRKIDGWREPAASIQTQDGDRIRALLRNAQMRKSR